MGHPDIGIIRFPEGTSITLDEARTGGYVFAVGPRSRTIVAFDREGTGEHRARDQIRAWARLQGLEETLARGQAKIKKVPPNPSARVDQEAERKKVKRIRRELDRLADETGVPIGPRLLHAAVTCGIFGSALLYSDPLYRAQPTLPLSESCPDLDIHGWSTTESCTTDGYDNVYLYEEPDYGPDKLTPAVTLVGTDGIDQIPSTQIASVFFE
jgi:hypothetical protein